MLTTPARLGDRLSAAIQFFWVTGSVGRPRDHNLGVGPLAAQIELLEDRTLLNGVLAAVVDGPLLHAAEHAAHIATPFGSLAVDPGVSDEVAALYAAQSPPAAAPPFPLGQTFLLNSSPSSSKVIYLDFNGHTTNDPSWNSGTAFDTPAYDIDNNVASFSNQELENIQIIWQHVMEDFAPFDVNVTTEDPGIERLRNTGGGDTQWGIRVVIGGDGAWYGSAGGVAYIGSFTDNVDRPTFVFEDNLGDGFPKFVAEAISHEVGHTLGLDHDGRTSPAEDYYEGHGSGPTGWAPSWASDTTAN
ncbi:MAG: zinc-dependent metalloprotease family protein [Planctomycetaceae bacterium]